MTAFLKIIEVNTSKREGLFKQKNKIGRRTI